MSQYLKLSNEDEIKRNEIIQKRILDLIDELSNESLLKRPDCYYYASQDSENNRYNNDKTFFLINSIVKAMDENISIVDLNKIPKNVEEK